MNLCCGKGDIYIEICHKMSWEEERGTFQVCSSMKVIFHPWFWCKQVRRPCQWALCAYKITKHFEIQRQEKTVLALLLYECVFHSFSFVLLTMFVFPALYMSSLSCLSWEMGRCLGPSPPLWPHVACAVRHSSLDGPWDCQPFASHATQHNIFLPILIPLVLQIVGGRRRPRTSDLPGWEETQGSCIPFVSPSPLAC